MGSDTTSKAVQLYLAGKIRPFGERQGEMADKGADPKDIVVELPDRYSTQKCRYKLSFSFFLALPSFSLASSAIDISTEVARLMGTDCTANAASLQVHRKVVPLGERQRRMADAGLDPKDVEMILPDPYSTKKCCLKLPYVTSTAVCFAFPCLAGC
jgi:hypothetical protein